MFNQKKQNQKGSVLIFWAIIIAALIIGGALLWTRQNGKTDLSSKNTQANSLKTFNLSDYPTIGNPSAKITVAVFADFQCHFCKLFDQTVKPALVEKYAKNGQIKLVTLDFPFLGEASGWAAQAAHCAGDQKKYWEYADKLHNVQEGHDSSVFARNNLSDMAQALSLNMDEFNQCLDSGKYLQKIKDSLELGKKLGVDGTPTIFINEQRIDGAQPLSVFEKAIEEELKK